MFNGKSRSTDITLKWHFSTQPGFTCSNSTMETAENSVKTVQSY